MVCLTKCQKIFETNVKYISWITILVYGSNPKNKRWGMSINKKKGEKLMMDMDKLLERAFDQLAKEEYEKHSVEFPEHRFSLKFWWKIHCLFRKIGVPKMVDQEGSSVMELFHPIHSKRRIVVIILLILMVVGGTAVAAEPFIRWLQNFSVEQSKDHVKIQNGMTDGALEHTKENFKKYRLKNLPEEYTFWLDGFDDKFQRYKISYHNTKNDILSLKQAWQEDDMAENLTSNMENIEDVKVNGLTGYYAKDNGVSSLILSNGVYKLVLDGNFSKEELLEIAP